MQKLYTATETPTALVVRTLRHKIITITCPPMSHSKDQPKGCKNEESVNQPANTIKYIETENFSASLITAAIKHYEDSKPKAS